ncbi:MAG TPA: ATP-binding protein [Catalimonadaceae bacterium]|nr:ATP-binding protein [Catalimonadaceae bacterium]HPI11282.1 ATP-binding protein [Catalimonadaceae bacterium]
MLRILHLEDLTADAELVEWELRNGNVKCEILVAKGKPDFKNALDNFQPDVVLSDHSLPAFNSVEAFEMVKAKDASIPFILVTATVSEEFAVASMRSGVYDYILKDRLQRLPQSVLNAINKRRTDAQMLKYLDDLIASEATLKNLNASLELKVQQRTAQLEKANQDLESFGYSVSHDLKTPLTVIHTAASLLAFKLSGKLREDEEKLIKNIVRNSVAMGKLIEDLMSLSHFSKASRIEKEEVDNQKLVFSIAEELRSDFPDVKLKIGNLLPVKGSPGLIRQVWVNLITNAMKFSSKNQHPTVEVSCESSKKWITCKVQDNGPGFEMEDPEKLFDVFYRLHQHEGFKGHGIGLAIVKRIIDNHDGKVWAEGKPGEGAAFYFRLPAINK